ncbi:MAG: hypothetical protein HY392_02830 [Candidatus Diapherotrites archaeon]|nr:hypothetical protein [Candidatus Diapherotrites archaeon]
MEKNMPQPTEALRLKLLKEEFKLRKKQPTAWTKTKFRKYANFRTRKAEAVVEATVAAAAVAPTKA